MAERLKLSQKFGVLSDSGAIDKSIPKHIVDNLNPVFELREYQKKAIAWFIHYIEKYNERRKPTRLLFNMATGSGKTLIMAACILHLYGMGYRDFLFFVNRTNTINKTRENFLNPKSSKYLFAEKIVFDGKRVEIKEVNDFAASRSNDINIVFMTIQELHNKMNVHRENSLTIEDFRNKKIVLISDEAHHINAWTKNKLNREEEEAKATWEGTVDGKIFPLNSENIMLEYTATIEDDPAIFEKYKDSIICEYSLRQFRQDGFSKDVKVLQASLPSMERALWAVILSQYRRKIAEKNGIPLKPVILMKSKRILESEEFESKFYKKMRKLSAKDIEKIRENAMVAGNKTMERAFRYFEREKITPKNLAAELKEDFSETKCIIINSKEQSEENQIKINTLEDGGNKIRCVFAVDKLNEGWDVLNLFDIVRLYNTRDTKSNRPGTTTIGEAQLIGRGARYFPFVLPGKDEKYKRKFDQDLENDLKVLEDLHYHSAHNPKYIQELTAQLKRTGIMPVEQRDVRLKVKRSIKTTDFWRRGFIFVNKREDADRSQTRDISDLDIPMIYKYNMDTGFVQEKSAFEDAAEPEQVGIARQYNLDAFSDEIIRKAISRLDFYRFDNLKKYFPPLGSVAELVKSLKRKIKVELRSSARRLDSLSPDDRLEVCVHVLGGLEAQIRKDFAEYRGTKLFFPSRIKELVKDTTRRINVGDTGQGEGFPMSRATEDDLRLDLSSRNWYVYDENYGTSEEKHFIMFVNDVIEKMKKKYSEIYLLRNERLFKIYNFSGGRAFEPDFVLFLKEKGKKRLLQYQLFIEAKGGFLRKDDEWKEEFLKEVEGKYRVLAENKRYKLVGLPFYTEERKTEFIEEFNKKLNLNQ
jgi:type III restriction enzyme